MKTHTFKVLVPFQHGTVLDWVGITVALATLTPGTVSQALHHRREYSCRLFHRPTHFGKRHKMRWFDRLDELSPLDNSTRPTVEAIPGVSARPYRFPRFPIDEAMPQHLGIRTDIEGIRPIP
jgi:hypothetical protein